jgi:epoxyqueuosine reductase
LDARLCISYLTIEHPGWIERDLRAKMGNWVFGCDVCQSVCPWNRFAVQTLETDFFPIAPDRAAPPLTELLALTPADFDARYRGTPVHRLGLDRLLRNACVAAGNSQRLELLGALENLLGHASPLVRGHAAWALGQLAGVRLAPVLQARWDVESHPQVRREIQSIITH